MYLTLENLLHKFYDITNPESKKENIFKQKTTYFFCSCKCSEQYLKIISSINKPIKKSICVLYFSNIFLI